MWTNRIMWRCEGFRVESRLVHGEPTALEVGDVCKEDVGAGRAAADMPADDPSGIGVDHAGAVGETPPCGAVGEGAEPGADGSPSVIHKRWNWNSPVGCGERRREARNAQAGALRPLGHRPSCAVRFVAS